MTSLGLPLSPVSRSSFEAPRGSILLNSNERPVVVEKKSMRNKPPAVRIIPIPIEQTRSNTSTYRSNDSSSPTAEHHDPEGTTSPGVASPCIRFAPLPDPHRPRSLSTGRNLGTRVSEGPNGEREYTLELRNMGHTDHFDTALDDEESKSSDDDMDEDEDYDWERDGGRRRSWAVSMGMGSAWTGTKKLVGLKPDSGMKKSGSASSFGTSPSTTSSFLSPGRGRRGSTASTGSNSSHRRTGSSDSKPAPAKMLNGRVYGARRASEAAAMERMRRERNEPDFVEWGNTGAVGTNSNNAPASRSLGSKSAFDDDDGGGMAWVRKRREERERERKAKEEAEAEAAAANPAAPSITLAPPADVDTTNPGMSPAHRPESLSSASSASSHGGARGPTGPLTPHDASNDLADGTFSTFAGFNATAKRSESLDMAPDDAGMLPEDHDAEHHLHAVRIPTSRFRRRSGAEDEDDYEDEEDDGDFEQDDEDEEELVGQKCAAAAGIEVVARHH